MTDAPEPDSHPFADYFRETSANGAPRSRREAREAQQSGTGPASTFAQRAAAASTPRPTSNMQVFDGPPATPAAQPRGGNGTPPPRRRRGRRGLIALIVIVVLIGGLVAAGSAIYGSYEPQITKMFGGSQSEDFSGTGNGEKVDFVINSGDVGEVIGDNLAAAGVVKSSSAFYDLLLKQPDVVFQPGTYSLQKEMSAQSALTALEDPANHVTDTVVIPEGTLAADVLTKVSESTGVALADLQAQAANVTQFGIDASAPNIEGYLFPATYTFEPGMNAHDLIKTMVDRTIQSLDAAGVAPADREKTLILASIIQKEAAQTPDFYKVSRVFLNRIADDMPLQSDATVAYGTGEKRVDTTDAERNDESNKYNTYVYTGLPVGPISNPGDTAIDAALHPADGSWIYFVTVNLDTGETVFSTTLAEHEQAVAQYQAWSAANPGAGG